MTHREKSKDCVGMCDHLSGGACRKCIESAIKEAIAEERERCAQVAETASSCGQGCWKSIAAAIRGGAEHDAH